MLDWIAPVACAGCGRTHAGRICPDCLPPVVHRAPVPAEGVAGCFTLAGYDGPLVAALKRAKYGVDRGLCRVLGQALGRRLAPVARDAFDAVVPAPSPWDRRLQRGFNPAAVLAREVGHQLDLPVVHALRVSRGPRQAGLNASERRRSLVGRVRSRRPVSGRVLLVDDVATTGATASACARELLGEGSAEVWLAVLCRPRERSADGS